MLGVKLWWLAYDDGRILRSTDGGISWCDLVEARKIQFEEGAYKYFTALHFVNAERGWGLGSDRFLYETSDGGKQWTRVSSEVRIDSMHFPNQTEGFLTSSAGVFRSE